MEYINPKALCNRAAVPSWSVVVWEGLTNARGRDDAEFFMGFLAHVSALPDGPADSNPLVGQTRPSRMATSNSV